MKKITSKLVLLISVVLMVLSITNMPALAATGEDKILFKASEKEFIIYYKDICNNEFEFAFSTKQDEDENALNFTKSVEDQAEGESLNVAFIDEDLYNDYFAENQKAYIWLKDMEGKTLVKADEINLSEAIDEEKITAIEDLTERIEVDTKQKEEKNEKINEVDTTVTRGKVVITDKKDATYYYQLIKVTDEDYKKLFEKVEEIENGVTGTYNQLKALKEFYNLYTKLEPKADDKNWLNVENKEILEPEDTYKGDKYILWLKSENGEDIIIDAQFLVSDFDYTPKYDKEEDKVITEIVKSPVTYDSIALIVAFAVIILAIIVVAILKLKNNKKGKHA